MGTYAPTVETVEATARLLTDGSWRRRVVEKVLPLTADHYELRRSFQFDSPDRLISDLMTSDGPDLLLPVCWMPKEPLLSFDLHDAGGTPLPVIDRSTNALILAEILDSWQEALGLDIDSRIGLDTLVAVCQTSLAPWNQAERATKSPDAVDILRTYYEDLLGLHVSPVECQAIYDTAVELGSAAIAALGTSDAVDPWIPTTLNPAILAPFTRQVKTPADLFQVINTIADNMLDAITGAASVDGGRSWLELLHRAGDQWPVLVPMPREHDGPLLIKTKEVRKSGDRRSRRFVHEADMSAALSYHLEVRAPEPSVKLKGIPKIYGPGAQAEPLGAPGAFDSARVTDEIFTTYSSSIDRPDRPDHATVEIRYALYATAIAPDAFALALTLSALVITLVFSASIDSSFAAVILIPTTVVAGFITIRDSVLVSSFLRPVRLALPTLNVILWIWVLTIVGLSLSGGS